MNGVIAGAFGRRAEVDRSAVRRSLGAGVARELRSGALTLAWTGEQPSSGLPTVALAGRVRNLPALASELGVERERHAEDVLAFAFRRWSERMLDRLRGGFALVAWDAEAERGLLAVDQLGAGSLFLHESPGGLTFATEIRNLLGLLPVAPAPADGGVVQWLADGHLERGQTLFEGVRRLEGGHLVSLVGDGWRRACYWSPSYTSPGSPDEAELAAGLGSHIERAVLERLADDVATGVLVSGGLDSSTVAAVARRLVPASTGVRAYSLVFPDHPEADESAMIGRLTSELDIPSRRAPVHGGGALPPALEFQAAWEVPAFSPTLVFNLPLLRQAAQEGIAVMLDGEGGDELFGCSPYLVADRLRRVDVRGALELARRLPGVDSDPSYGLLWSLLREYGIKGVAPYTVHRVVARAGRSGRYSAPDWLTPESARAYHDLRDGWSWKRIAGPRWWAYLSQLLTVWRERMGAHDFLRRRAALAGLESRHPLLDDLDLIEFVLRLPPDLAFDAQLDRPFLRTVVSGLLPDEIRLRGDKSDFSSLFVDSLSRHDRPLVAELLAQPNAEIFAYARPERIRSLLDAPPEHRNVAWAWQVWRLATTECWLRSQSEPGIAHRLLETRPGAEMPGGLGVGVSDRVSPA